MLFKKCIFFIVLLFCIQLSFAWSIWDKINDKASEIGKDAKNTINTGIQNVGKFGDNLVDDAKNLAKDAENTINNGINNVGKIGNDVVDGAVKIVNDATNLAKIGVKQIEELVKKIQNEISDFANKLISDIQKSINNILDNKSYDDIFQQAKQGIKSFQNVDLLKKVCSAPIPPIIQNMISIKDDICDHPINLIEIKTRIQKLLSELKQTTIPNIGQYARQFLDSIRHKLNELKPNVLEKFTDMKKLLLQQSDVLENILNELMKYLEEPTKENIDKILNSFEKLIKLSINLIEDGKKTLNETISSITDKETIVLVLNELKKIAEPIFNIKKNIIDGVNGIAKFGILFESNSDKIKMLTELPQSIINADRNVIGSFTDIKLLGLNKTDNLLTDIFRPADVLKLRKLVICLTINNKIRTLKSVSKFICDTVYDLDEQFDKLFNNIDGSQHILHNYIRDAESYIRTYTKNQDTDDQKKLYSNLKKNLINELNDIKNHKDLQLDITREFRKSIYEFTQLLNNINQTSKSECGIEILSNLPNLEEKLKDNLKVCTEGIDEINENGDSTELIKSIDESLNNFKECADDKKCIATVTDQIKSYVAVKSNVIVYAKTKFNNCVKEKVINAKNQLQELLDESDNCSESADDEALIL